MCIRDRCRCSPTVAAIETSAGASRTPRDRARRAPRRDARGRPRVSHRRVLRRRFPRVEPAQSPGPPAASSPPRCCTGPCSTWSPRDPCPPVVRCRLRAVPPILRDGAETGRGRRSRAITSSRAPRLLPARTRRLCARDGTARGLRAGVTKQPRPRKFWQPEAIFWHGDRTCEI